MTRTRLLSTLAILTLLFAAAPANAYIGPGAGFALLSSFLVLFTTIVVAILSLLIWPFRTLLRIVSRRRPPQARVKRLIVVGFDGQDPRLTDRFMAAGKLPNFQQLAASGCYHPIKTTFPSVSPVAWSSFSTGTNPGKHNIFDFMSRDPRTYLPNISSTAMGQVEKFLKLGKFRVPLQKPELRLLRKSKPFWSILGEHGIWSTVLRVPITFPPDNFYGAQIAAMSVPDLLGTQGTFLLYTTRPSEGKFKEGGIRVELSPNGSPDAFSTTIEGPENIFREDEAPLSIPMSIELDRAGSKARVKVGKETVDLALGELSDWVSLVFKPAPAIHVHGICRMKLLELGEHVSLYLSPISIDPGKPAMPVSHPSYYAPYMAKRIGPFTTMGLAEDTWALNEGVTDDATFLTQTYDIDKEREEMFFAALDRLRKGSLVCVFDATDRIQHMFWRYLEEGHPAAQAANGKEPEPEHREAIARLYEHNDRLVGKVREKLRRGDLLVVLSDHGFTSFRRGINLNSWLLENGYLKLKEGRDGSNEWLEDIDWSGTRAYALGLCGMYLNIAGREEHGIVAQGKEAAELKREIRDKLRNLRDEEKGEIAINEAFDASEIYDGPYTRQAPDLILGYNSGYRISWDGASGMASGPVFEDNTKAWSGDHGIDPRLVPGVFFCSHKVDVDELSLVDLAPTALELFGITPPKHMEGRSLFKPGPLPEVA